MFNSNVFDFGPTTPEQLIDKCLSVATDALLHEFKAESVDQAHGYAILRAVRWLVIGFGIICLAALALGVAIGGVLVVVGRWVGPRLSAHCSAVDSTSVEVLVGAVRGWVASAVKYSCAGLGKSVDNLNPVE